MTPIRFTKIRSDRNNYIPKRLKQFNAISLRQFVGIKTGVLGKKDPSNLGHLRSILEKFGMPSENITERLLHVLIDRIASNPDASLILPKDIKTDLIYTLRKLQHQKIIKTVDAHYKNIETESGLHILNLKMIHVPTIVSALKENQAILLIEPLHHKHVPQRTAAMHNCNGQAPLRSNDETLNILIAKIYSVLIKTTKTVLNQNVEFPVVQSAMRDFLSGSPGNEGGRLEQYIRRMAKQLREGNISDKRIFEIAAAMENACKEYFVPCPEELTGFVRRVEEGPDSASGEES